VILALLPLLLPAPAEAATAEQFMNAMDFPASATVLSWSGNPEQIGVTPALGPLTPTVPPVLGILSTGTAETYDNCTDTDWMNSLCSTTCDPVHVQVQVEVPANANSISFDFEFLSREYPEWLNQGFNDTFSATLASGAFNGNIVFDTNSNPITVDSAFFDIGCCHADPLPPPCNYTIAACPLLGSGAACIIGEMHDGGGTGWLTTRAPVLPGEVITLTFEIYDEGDGIFDSAVVLDNFGFSTEVIEDPVTAPELRVTWVSPKVGPVSGGQRVRVFGTNFYPTAQLEVALDGVLLDPADIFPINESTLEFRSPPWPAPETVDLRVTTSASEATLGEAYTYADLGDLPPLEPVLRVVEPRSTYVEGGATLLIRGENFTPTSQVQLGAALIPASEIRFTDARQLAVAAPSAAAAGLKAEGVVDLWVINDGELRSDPPYPLLYAGNAPVSEGSTSAGCAQPAPGQPNWPTVLLVTLLVPVALGRSRRVR
jgi:hypothetical protein